MYELTGGRPVAVAAGPPRPPTGRATPPRAWRRAGGGGGRARDDREAAGADTTCRPGRAGSTPRGGELPQYDNGPAGEPEGRGRRAPGGAWGQLSEEARDELTRPLRVESGRTSSPGKARRSGSRTTVIFDREGHASPSLKRSRRMGGGEPRTIERPRVRARLVDQGEPARPPWEGWRRDTMPPPSPGETPAGPSMPSESVEPEEAGEDEGRQRRRRHQQRGKRPHRPSHDARETSKRANQGGSGPWEDGG